MVKADGTRMVTTVGKFCDATGEKIAGDTQFREQIIPPAFFRLRLPGVIGADDKYVSGADLELDFTYTIGVEILNFILDRYPEIAERYNHILEPRGLDRAVPDEDEE